MSVLPNAVVYVATKGAIEQAARSLSKDLGARGITVNCVSPGPTDTPLFRAGKPEGVINFIAGLHPAKRLGNPAEIAPTVTFLASPGAAWVNGQNIRVNGVRTQFYLIEQFSYKSSSRPSPYKYIHLTRGVEVDTFVVLVVQLHLVKFHAQIKIKPLYRIFFFERIQVLRSLRHLRN